MAIDPRRIEVMDGQVAAIMRAKSPAEKLAMLDEMWLLARSLAEAGVRRSHPQWTDAQVQREVARRISHGSD